MRFGYLELFNHYPEDYRVLRGTFLESGTVHLESQSVVLLCGYAKWRLVES